MKRKPQFLILATVAPLALVLLWLGNQDAAPPQAAPRDEAELARLDDRVLVAELAAETAHRMYARGYDPGAWHRLDGPPLHLWMVVSIEGEILRSGLAGFLAETPAGSPRPGLAELALAYREVGLTGLAALADEAAQRFERQPDVSRDASFYADLQVRLVQQMRKVDAPRLLIAYGRKNLTAFAAVPRP